MNSVNTKQVLGRLLSGVFQRIRLALFGLCLAASAGWAAESGSEVTLNFVNADLESVIKAVGQISGRNFIIDPRVKGTVNIVSAKPVPAALTYQILLSALRLQGFAAVESAGAILIVPEAEAKHHFSPTTQNESKTKGDRIVTEVFMLKHESASQLVVILRPLITPNNTISAYANTNSLVITDYAENLARIRQIIDSVDQPSVVEPTVIPLRHASAVEVSIALNKLLVEGAVAMPGADNSQRLVVVPDMRSNSLIVRSDNPSRLTRLRSLVEQMDQPASAAGNIHVVYLKNSDATKLAQTLRAIISGDTSSAAATAGAAPAGSMGAIGNPGSAGAGAPGGAGIIQADLATNALIITASDAVFNNLREVIEKLDIRRAQVYVEALIAEVTADKAAEFGIQWQNFDGVTKNNIQGIGGVNFGTRGAGGNIIDTSTNLSSVGKGLNLGIVKGQVNIPGIGTITNLGLLARALETDAHANILSTPNLLTLDNEEAKIVIGQNVPFITGQYAQTGTAGTTASPFQTIERRDVGLTLKIKPLITEGGTVRLQIFQEISNVQDTTNSAGIITNKRSLESTVLIEDGQIVVLGGLIQDSVSNGVDKVPVLGDIPLLGAFFSYESRKRSKTNLMVFLKPVVIRATETQAKITSDRYDYIMGVQKEQKFEHHLMLPDDPKIRMPDKPQPAAPAATGVAPKP